MLMAQVTDIHLGFDPDNPAEFNRKRLDQALKTICDMIPQPDVLLATGDLVDRGDQDSYRRLENAFSVVPFPVYMCLGNHDLRAPFQRQFPDVPTADGFVQYEVDDGALRLIFLDTLEEGRHGGAFCEVRAQWLADRLTEKQDKPTVLILHHPPVESGIAWMNTHPDEPWVDRLADTISGHDQVVGMITGHLHRNISTSFAGTSLSICASTAPQVAFDLEPIDPENPDGRNMIVADPPAIALHWWNGKQIVSHFETAEEHVMLARYDKNLQPLVRALLAERPE
ncbi:phosphodiesterase [Parasphingorhabdus halotolerans]|uniref:Phosphodiesterase n=1 Tax=Parasphingorhabdus halotolerans TaxID=2725558 RepID=A0A6H2DRQ7_9SPHN|nr:phosphodiesterase [Parasphingorhabdus halotolerans]QJB70441.1 phosphodiesterase [Parasphingorhabdus halotolerans]